MADVNIKIQVLSSGAQKAVGQLAKQTDKADKSFKSLNLDIKTVNKTMSVFKGNLAAIGVTKAISVLAQGFRSFTTSVIDNSIELETLTTQFEVLTQSADGAAKIIKDLQDFSATTPFQFAEIANAAKTLLAFGFSAEETQGNLRVLGDVAAATGKPLGDLALVFGQVRAAGKLTGERLLQFQERAVPIGPALAKTLGVAETAIKDMVSRGEIDFNTFQKAFQSLNKEGSFAFEGMIKRSKTLGGLISTVKDNFVLFSQSLGQKLLPALRAIAVSTIGIIQGLTKMGSAFSSTEEVSKGLVDAFNKFVGLGSFVVQAFLGIRAVANLLSAGLVALLTPLVLIVEGILNLVSVATVLSGMEFEGLNNLTENVQNLRKNMTATAGSLVDDAEDIAVSMVKLGNESDKLTKTITTNLNADLKASATSKKETVKDNQDKQDSITKLTDKEIAENQKRLQEKVKFENAKAALDAEFKSLTLEKQLAADGEIDARDQLEILKEQDKLAQIREANEIHNSELLGNQRATDNLRAKFQNEQLKRDIGISKAQNAVSKATDDETLKQRRSFFSAAASLSGSQNKVLLGISKAAALAQIAINTPESVSNSFKFGSKIGGPPLGFVFGAIAATAQAAQAAKVSGLAFEQGGIVPGNSFTGDNVFARVNSGEMILNRQQQAQLFNSANGSGGVGQEIVVNSTIQLDGEAVGKSVSRQVADGLKLGEVV